MNAIAVTNQTFTIAETVINMVDGLYSLNDLHKASGNVDKHQPAFFVRNQEVTELVEEIMQSANLQSDQVIRKVNGGHNRGTYACKEIVYRYAMWISPKFALIVIRAFDALVTRTDSKQREALITACDKLAIRHALRSEIYTMVAKEFGYEKVTQIPTPLLPEAIAFVYEMLIRKQNQNDTSTLEEYKEQLYRVLHDAYEHGIAHRQLMQAYSHIPFGDYNYFIKLQNQLFNALGEIAKLANALGLKNSRGRPLVAPANKGVNLYHWDGLPAYHQIR